MSLSQKIKPRYLFSKYEKTTTLTITAGADGFGSISLIRDQFRCLSAGSPPNQLPLC